MPDTGAKDGLCGDKRAHHATKWAMRHGHKWEVSKLPERRVVRGVGSGTQHVDDSVLVPIGLEYKKGKLYVSHYKAAVIRNSNLPALFGMDSLDRLSPVIRCRTGEI